MLIGVGIAIVNFLLGYVRLPVVSRKPRSSGAARTLSERRVLEQKRDAIAFFELSGFLFFGSSVQILDIVQKAVYVRKKLPGAAADAEDMYLGDVDMPLTPSEHRTPLIECLDGSPASDPGAQKLLAGPVVDSASSCASYNVDPVNTLEQLADSIGVLQLPSSAMKYFEVLEVPAEHVFYSSGQSADCLYFLAHGSVHMCYDNDSNNSDVLELGQLPIVRPGCLFCEAVFFSRQQRRSTATAMESCTVLEMNRNAYNSMLDASPTDKRSRGVVVCSEPDN
ncbi:unnamed protein product [Phytophthora lilii]|uniref:Unnamed protein product n=1 Tax=Phytophthora lilii TaxID=2077276 RepID=A0A9W6XNH9_9STRA|nr:unnamed protein product [Phytophthora lilii]